MIRDSNHRRSWNAVIALVTPRIMHALGESYDWYTYLVCYKI